MHNSAETWLSWRDSKPTGRGIGASRSDATRHDRTRRDAENNGTLSFAFRRELSTHPAIFTEPFTSDNFLHVRSEISIELAHSCCVLSRFEFCPSLKPDEITSRR